MKRTALFFLYIFLFKHGLAQCPPIQITAGNNGPLCTQGNLQLTATTIPGATYSWTGPNLFTSSLQNPVINNIAISQAGTYTVTATLNGCTSTATTNVVLIPAVVTPPFTWNNSPVCVGQPLYLNAAPYIGGSYNWTGPNGFSDTTMVPIINNVSFQDSGTYIVTVTVNGCTSAPSSSHVAVKATPAPPVASNNSPLCEGEILNLTASTVPGATYQWSNSNGFSSTLQNPVISNVSLSDGGIYGLTATVNGCTSAPTITVAIIKPIPPTPVASTNGPLCEGQTLNLTANTIAGTTYSWQGPNGFISTLQNPVIANVTLANAGLYSVTASTNGCISIPGTTTALISQVINTPVITSNSPICTGGTLTLNTPFIQGVSYNWSGPNGFSSTLQNPVINNISTLSSGVYTLTVTGCNSASNIINVMVDSTPVISTITNNGPLCEGQALTLNTNSIAGATYKWTGPNGFNSTNQNPVINIARLNDAGAYNVLANLKGCNSLPATTTAVIGDSSVSNAGNSQGVCADAMSVNLNGKVTGGNATGIWSTSGTGTFSPDNTTLNASYILSTADKSGGNLTLTLTSANNGACPVSRSSLQLTILNAIMVNAGPDKDICASDNNINLAGQVTTAGGIWSTTGSGTFSPSNSSLAVSYTPSVADKAKQNINLILTSTGNGGCKPVSDTTVLKINPGPSVNAGPDIFIIENDTKVLSPVVTGTNLLYAWTPGFYLNNSSVKNPVVTGVNDQKYTLTITDNFGCSNQDDVFVKVLKNLTIANTFTPNNDGINDTWLIPNLQEYPDCRVQVYNRYGQLVFQSKGYTRPWNGTKDEKSLPAGTYYYIIEPGSGRKPVTGYVTLIK